MVTEYTEDVTKDTENIICVISVIRGNFNPILAIRAICGQSLVTEYTEDVTKDTENIIRVISVIRGNFNPIRVIRVIRGQFVSFVQFVATPSVARSRKLFSGRPKVFFFLPHYLSTHPVRAHIKM